MKVCTCYDDPKRYAVFVQTCVSKFASSTPIHKTNFIIALHFYGVWCNNAQAQIVIVSLGVKKKKKNVFL